MGVLLAACALAAVVFLLLIALYLILAGLPAIRKAGLGEFLLGTVWDSTNAEAPRFGILPMLLTSLWGAAGAVVLGVPVLHQGNGLTGPA